MSTSTAEPRPLRALREALRTQRVAAAVQRRKHGAALDDAHRAIERHRPTVDRLERIAECMPLVDAAIGDVDRQMLDAKRARAAGIGADLSGEIDTETLERTAERLDALTALVGDIQSVLHRAWRRRIRDEFGAFAQLARIIGQLSLDLDPAGDLGDVARRALALADAFPPDEATRAAFAACIERRDAVLARLAAAGSGIDAFLLAVARGTATLADLDDGILEWLDEVGARHHFKVGL